MISQQPVKAFLILKLPDIARLETLFPNHNDPLFLDEIFQFRTFFDRNRAARCRFFLLQVDLELTSGNVRPRGEVKYWS